MNYNELIDRKFLIAGPCVIESEDICFDIAETCKKIAEDNGFLYIFKASFDKANRTSINSYRGVSIAEANSLFNKIKSKFNLPILTDVHESYQPELLTSVDILQIPAFLCRQTDLLLSAGKTGKIVNIKKAQFLSATDMVHAIEKVKSTGNNSILLTERGTSFGYNNLVVDFRNIVDMMKYDLPVVFDLTHSTQRPGGNGSSSGGNPEYAPYLSRAVAAIGVKGFFIELHREPKKALSDGANMIALDELDSVLKGINKHLI